MEKAPPPPPGGKIKASRIVTATEDWRPLTLLVIEADARVNWYEIFKGARVGTRAVQVEQTEWPLITVTEASANGCRCTLAPSREPHMGTTMKNEREVMPDFILIRQFVRGIHNQHWMSTLYAFMIANIPAVNSLHSVYCAAERAACIAELNRIKRKLGNELFPYVPLTYYPNGKDTVPTPSKLPVVAKVGSSCAGFGKMKFNDDNFVDFSTLVAMTTEYVTVEPFVKAKGDLRIQSVGGRLRAFYRFAENWKGNVGESRLEDTTITPQLQAWADEVAVLWGGLDIFSIDALIHDGGSLTILEINDTATGLHPSYAAEDRGNIRDLVLRRMMEAFSTKPPA